MVGLKWRRVRTSCEVAAVVAAAAVEEGSRPGTAGLGSTACTAAGCPGGELGTGQNWQGMAEAARNEGERRSMEWTGLKKIRKERHTGWRMASLVSASSPPCW